MAELRYVVGDATRPAKTLDELVVIAHIVNDVGAWGRGFVVALSRWDDNPERAYRRWASGDFEPGARGKPFALGHTQTCSFGPATAHTWVVNLVAQRGLRRRPGDPQALDLEALRACLRDLCSWVGGDPYGVVRYRVVMPRIGCGLGGARWADVAPVIQAELVDRGIDVTVYSLPGERWDD